MLKASRENGSDQMTSTDLIGLVMPGLAFCYWFIWMTREVGGVLVFGDGESFPLSQTIGPLFATAALIVQVVRGSLRLNWPRCANWLFAYFIWSGISIVWTTAESPGQRFLQWAEFGGQMLFICLSTSSDSSRKAVLRSSLMGLAMGGCCLGLYVISIFKPDYDMRADQTLHPNFLGHRIALAALASLFLWTLGKNRWLWLPASILLMVSLLFTTSKTSIGAWAACSLLFLLFHPRLSRNAKLRLLTALVFAMAAALPLVIRNFEVYADTSSALTLTGRVPLWIAVVGKILERPLLGFGYHSFSDNWPAHRWFSGNAHDEFLQEWFTLGLIGVVLLTAAYRNIFRALRQTKSEYARFGTILLAYCLIRGFAEADDTHLQLALLFSCSLPRIAEQFKLRFHEHQRLRGQRATTAFASRNPEPMH